MGSRGGSTKIETKFEIGQEVYCYIGYTNNKIHEAEIVAIFANRFEDKEVNTNNYRIVDKYDYVYTIPEDQIFATPEEAEAKLKEMQDEDSKKQNQW